VGVLFCAGKEKNYSTPRGGKGFFFPLGRRGNGHDSFYSSTGEDRREGKKVSSPPLKERRRGSFEGEN